MKEPVKLESSCWRTESPLGIWTGDAEFDRDTPSTNSRTRRWTIWRIRLSLSFNDFICNFIASILDSVAGGKSCCLRHDSTSFKTCNEQDSSLTVSSTSLSSKMRVRWVLSCCLNSSSCCIDEPIFAKMIKKMDPRNVNKETFSFKESNLFWSISNVSGYSSCLESSQIKSSMYAALNTLFTIAFKLGSSDKSSVL